MPLKVLAIKHKRDMIIDGIEYYDPYKKNKRDKIYWLDSVDFIGRHTFSFDLKRVYNLFADYPHNLTKQEKEIFDKENPEWKDFFKDRQ